MQVGINPAMAGGPSVFDLPKLEPAYKDEKARVFIPDIQRIWMGYRHGIGGQRTGAATFGGNWLCTGRDEVLRANVYDPEACLLCRLAKDERYTIQTVTPQGQAVRNPIITKPTRKYVTQVFRYNADPSGMSLMQPFGAMLLTWQFSEQEYRALVTLDTAWAAQGGVTAFDLLLNAKDKGFKTWEVSILPQSFWRTDQGYVAYITESYQNGVSNDLEALIGRKEWGEADVMAKVSEVMGGGAPGMGGIAQQYGQQMQPQMGMQQPNGMPPMQAPPGMAQPMQVPAQQPLAQMPASPGVGTPQMVPPPPADITAALTQPPAPPMQQPMATLAGVPMEAAVPPPALPQQPLQQAPLAPQMPAMPQQAPAPQMPAQQLQAPPPPPAAAVPAAAPAAPVVDFAAMMNVPPPPPPAS